MVDTTKIVSELYLYLNQTDLRVPLLNRPRNYTSFTSEVCATFSVSIIWKYPLLDNWVIARIWTIFSVWIYCMVTIVDCFENVMHNLKQCRSALFFQFHIYIYLYTQIWKQFDSSRCHRVLDRTVNRIWKPFGSSRCHLVLNMIINTSFVCFASVISSFFRFWYCDVIWLSMLCNTCLLCSPHSYLL